MKTLSTQYLAAAITAGALLAPAVGQATVPSFSNIYYFGDSLSDSGNAALALEALGMTGASAGVPQVITNTYVGEYPYPVDGTYFPATLSNGPVWASRFASRLGLSATASLIPGGTNFAFGSARVSADVYVPSLQTQVGLFLGSKGGVAPGDALYVVGGGGNDARDALAEIAGGADLTSTTAAHAGAYATGMGTIVDTLKASGAQDILVLNNANIGVGPAVRAMGPIATSVATGVSQAFNVALGARLAGVPGVRTFDTFSFVTGVFTDPAAYGLANVDDACGGAPAGTNCNQYMFWDGIHPTAATHKLVAKAVFAQVVPEPETYALMALGLGVIGWMARRRATA